MFNKSILIMGLKKERFKDGIIKTDLMALEKLRFAPKKQIFAARFTEKQAKAIRQFCKEENIKYSDILRYSIKQLISNF